MNRNALYLAVSAFLLGSTVVALAYGVARLSDARPRPINVAWASDRELLQCYGKPDWTGAFAELKRRAAGYSYKESTDLAFETLAVGFRMRPDRYVQTSFFEFSVAFLPKPLADWVQIEGPRRREAFANAVFDYLKEQRMRAQFREPVDVDVLMQLYDDLATPDRYPLFWAPRDYQCSLAEPLPRHLQNQIQEILAMARDVNR